MLAKVKGEKKRKHKTVCAFFSLFFCCYIITALKPFQRGGKKITSLLIREECIKPKLSVNFLLGYLIKRMTLVLFDTCAFVMKPLYPVRKAKPGINPTRSHRHRSTIRLLGFLSKGVNCSWWLQDLLAMPRREEALPKRWPAAFPCPYARSQGCAEASPRHSATCC